jgi:environmental stress-induced protein Ves
VSFVAGTGIAHCFVNRGTSDCRLFTVAERRANERSFYAEDKDYDAFFARERPESHWVEGLASPVRRLTTADYRVMPWRNGGGSTTELVIGGEESGRFLYRASIADVATSGPFSRFDGYDRHIMLLEGDGMTIDCKEHGQIALDMPFVPHSFVSGTRAARSQPGRCATSTSSWIACEPRRRSRCAWSPRPRRSRASLVKCVYCTCDRGRARHRHGGRYPRILSFVPARAARHGSRRHRPRAPEGALAPP